MKLHLDYTPQQDVNSERPETGHETDMHVMTADEQAMRRAEYATQALFTLRRADREYLALSAIEDEQAREVAYQSVMIGYRRAARFFAWAGYTVHGSATADERAWFERNRITQEQP